MLLILERITITYVTKTMIVIKVRVFYYRKSFSIYCSGVDINGLQLLLLMRNYCTIAQMISEYYYETSTIAVKNGMELRPVTN